MADMMGASEVSSEFPTQPVEAPVESVGPLSLSVGSTEHQMKVIRLFFLVLDHFLRREEIVHSNSLRFKDLHI